MGTTEDRIKSIRKAEAASHTEAYTNYELFSTGSWLSKTVKTVLDLFPYFQNYQQLRVLDLGSGVGRNAIPIAKHFKDIPCHIDCVDILELAIDKLKDNARVHDVGNSIYGIVQPIDCFSIKEDSYDLILAISALEHIDSQNSFVKKLFEIRNGLHSNGIACLILNSGVEEQVKATGEALIPQFEVNIPTEEMINTLKEVFSEWKILKQTVVHQMYDIPRDIGISHVDTDVVTYVVQKP